MLYPGPQRGNIHDDLRFPPGRINGGGARMTAPDIYVRDVGKGRPLVLIHGWSCPGVFFDGQVEALHAVSRCIVPDLPGHGKTADRLPLTIEAAADALHAYLERQKVQDAVLCGWSMGALVAYAMIARHGAGRISRVVAIDMSPKFLDDADWRNGTSSALTAEQNTLFLKALSADWPRLSDRIARRLFADGLDPDPALLESSRQRIAAQDPVLLAGMWASLTEQDFRRVLSSFPVPLDLAAGLKSQLYGPRLHQWYQKTVPEFRLYGFEASGHAPHLEEPDRFNQLLRQVLDC